MAKRMARGAVTVADRARRTVEEELTLLSTAFIAEATPEEKRFMCDVLRDWQNYAGMGSDIAIFSAFQVNVDNTGTVKIPLNRLNDVRSFLAWNPMAPDAASA